MPTLMTGAPRVELVEKTLGSSASTTTAYGSSVFGNPRGPITPLFTSSWATWLANYGGSFLSWGYAGISAKAYLNNGPGMWNLRVVSSDCTYASSFAVFDIPYGSTTDQPTISNIYVNSNSLFSTNVEAVSAFTIKPTSTAYTSNSVTLSLTVTGVVNKTFSVTANLAAASDPYAWMTPLLTAIQTTLAADATIASTYPNGFVGYGETANGNSFVYFAPGLTVGATTSSTSISVAEDAFIQVYSRDPGASYANDYYGTSLSNFTTGMAQAYTVYFSSDLVSGNTVTLKITVGSKTYTVSQTYATSSSATVTALAATISALTTNGQLTFNAVASSYSGNGDINLITITASQAGRASFSMLSGDSLNYAITNTVAGKNNADTFTINVWNVSNTNTSLEAYTVSLDSQLDANGNQQNITTVLSGGASNQAASSYVRAYVGNLTSTYQPAVNGLIAPILSPVSVGYLGGGVDGSLPTNNQIAESWSTFTDTESYNINLLINSGYTDPSVQIAMANVADSRMDAIAILDLPSGYITAQTAADYRNNSINTVSTRAALYTPYVETVDPTTYKTVWAPPSGFVADRFVFTRNNYGNYYSPAGEVYGVLANVTDVAVNYYSLGDRNILDAAQINYIRRVNGAIVIDNDRTMIDDNGPLSSLNVRIMVNDIESYAVSVSSKYKFQLDNPASWSAIEKKMDAYLQTYLNAGAMNNAICSVTDLSNDPIYEDNAQINVGLYLIPVRATRYIYAGVAIGTNSVGITELEASGII